MRSPGSRSCTCQTLTSAPAACCWPSAWRSSGPGQVSAAPSCCVMRAWRQGGRWRWVSPRLLCATACSRWVLDRQQVTNRRLLPPPPPADANPCHLPIRVYLEVKRAGQLRDALGDVLYGVLEGLLRSATADGPTRCGRRGGAVGQQACALRCHPGLTTADKSALSRSATRLPAAALCSSRRRRRRRSET